MEVLANCCKPYKDRLQFNQYQKKEETNMPLPKTEDYTIEDIYALPDGQRAELFDGEIYMMSPPNRNHQQLVIRIGKKIVDYIDSNNGDCEVYPAPFAVFLNADNKTYVEPDLSVICDKDKLTEQGCNGAPDWVIEIVSPSTQRIDYNIKLFKYRTAGVREYWIVNPLKETVSTYYFEGEEDAGLYSFDEDIPVRIYQDFKINIAKLIA
jgi:Uma2 family endonuclease